MTIIRSNKKLCFIDWLALIFSQNLSDYDSFYLHRTIYFGEVNLMLVRTAYSRYRLSNRETTESSTNKNSLNDVRVYLIK